jgi:hypothetical protein
MKTFQSFHSFKLTADQAFPKARIRVGSLLRHKGETEIDRLASAPYYKCAADQEPVEAQLRS